MEPSHLRHRDVNIAVSGKVPTRAEEAVPLGEQVEYAGPYLCIWVVLCFEVLPPLFTHVVRNIPATGSTTTASTASTTASVAAVSTWLGLLARTIPVLAVLRPASLLVVLVTAVT